LETLQLLKVVLFLAVAVYSLVSVVKYFGRRVGDRGAFRSLVEHGRRIRVLSPEERAHLGPFLFDPRRPKRAVRLQSEDVFGLEGEFSRHGLEVEGSTIMHDTLGGVDVVLPYDARAFLEASNRAEVVLTPGFAVVVRLNETFDLAGGKERSLQQKADDQKWREGRVGEVADAKAPADANEAVAGTLRILGQRDETPAEAANRARPDWGLFAVLALAGAFAGLVAAGHSDDIWTWLVPSLLIFPLALWLIWRPKRIGKRKRVNRVQGSLAQVTWQSPDNPAIVRDRLFLGEKFPIEVPEHWKAGFPSQGEVTVDMRVDDYSVVSFGEKYSIDTEERKFPSIHWGRHVVFALAGVAMTIVAGSLIDRLGTDVAHVVSALAGKPTRAIDPSNLRETPAVGEMVAISGKVRCQLTPYYGDQPPRIDCRRVRLGGNDLQADDPAPSKAVAMLTKGLLLKTRKNAMLDMIMQLKMAEQGAAMPSDLFGNRPSPVIVEELTDLVLNIDLICSIRQGHSSACSSVEREISDNLVADEDHGTLPWESLVVRAKNGALKESGDSAVTSSIAVRSINQAIGNLTMPLLAQHYRGVVDKAMQSQRGGLLVSLVEDGGVSMQNADAENPSDWSLQWTAVKHLGSPEGLQALEVTGLVVRSERDPIGDPVITVDARRSNSNYPPALLRVLALVVGVAFLLLHLVLVVVNHLRTTKRKQAIQRYYQANG
jgi:hypothetical protein